MVWARVVWAPVVPARVVRVRVVWVPVVWAPVVRAPGGVGPRLCDTRVVWAPGPTPVTVGTVRSVLLLPGSSRVVSTTGLSPSLSTLGSPRRVRDLFVSPSFRPSTGRTVCLSGQGTNEGPPVV